jgi:hypothetical protein
LIQVLPKAADGRLGCPRKGVAVTLSGHRGEHRRESVTSQPCRLGAREKRGGQRLGRAQIVHFGASWVDAELWYSGDVTVNSGVWAVTRLLRVAQNEPEGDVYGEHVDSGISGA